MHTKFKPCVRACAGLLYLSCFLFERWKTKQKNNSNNKNRFVLWVLCGRISNQILFVFLFSFFFYLINTRIQEHISIYSAYAGTHISIIHNGTTNTYACALYIALHKIERNEVGEILKVLSKYLEGPFPCPFEYADVCGVWVCLYVYEEVCCALCMLHENGTMASLDVVFEHIIFLIFKEKKNSYDPR